MEHFGVQKYLRYYKLLSINYSNVSASSSSDLDLFWRRLYGDRHEIIFFQYDPTTKSAKQNNLHISMEPTAPEHE
jgi:hypothetical protein